MPQLNLLFDCSPSYLLTVDFLEILLLFLFPLPLVNYFLENHICPPFHYCFFKTHYSFIKGFKEAILTSSVPFPLPSPPRVCSNSQLFFSLFVKVHAIQSFVAAIVVSVDSTGNLAWIEQW